MDPGAQDPRSRLPGAHVATSLNAHRSHLAGQLWELLRSRVEPSLTVTNACLIKKDRPPHPPLATRLSRLTGSAERRAPPRLASLLDFGEGQSHAAQARHQGVFDPAAHAASRRAQPSASRASSAPRMGKRMRRARWPLLSPGQRSPGVASSRGSRCRLGRRASQFSSPLSRRPRAQSPPPHSGARV